MFLSTVLAMAPVPAPPAEVRPAEKPIRCSVELLPNYLFHLFVLGEIWKDRGMLDEAYIKAYGATLPAGDREALHRNRAWLAWGNGQSGALTGWVFFWPLHGGKLQDGKDYIVYLEALQKAYASPEGMRAFNAACPALAVGDWDIRYFDQRRKQDPKGFPAEGQALQEFTDVVRRNLAAYEKSVWPQERTKLEAARPAIEGVFAGTRSLEQWEAYLQTPFPGPAFTLVLTTPNRKAPDANDLSPLRYNFYFSPDKPQELGHYVQHEIGTNLLRGPRQRLDRDPALAREIEQVGCRPQGVIWRAFEALAEFYLQKVTGKPRKIWSGKGFDGQPFDFPVFFEAYDREFARDPKQGPEQMMRHGVAAFLARKKG